MTRVLRAVLAVLAGLWLVLIGWHAIELHRDRLRFGLSPDVIRTEA